MIAAARTWLERAGWPVVSVQDDGAVGRLTWQRTTEVQCGLGETEELVTLLHEIAHVHLGHVHTPFLLGSVHEEQAEALALATAHSLGQEVGTVPDYGPGLVAMAHNLAQEVRTCV